MNTSHLVSQAPAPLVRVHPSKFWAATRSMTRLEADQVLEHVAALAERGEYEELQKYEFVSLWVPPDSEAA